MCVLLLMYIICLWMFIEMLRLVEFFDVNEELRVVEESEKLDPRT